MILVFRLIYVCAALCAMAAALLVTSSLFIADRVPQNTNSLGISLVVSAVFVGMGIVLVGVQRHAAAVTAALRDPGGASAGQAPTHLRRLVAYLVAGGVPVCAALVILTYAILARIDQGFAVFG